MFKFSVIAIVATTLSSILTNNIVNAHMAMYDPAPRYSGYGSSPPQPPSGQTFDYNIKSPIGNSAGIMNPICKHTVPYSTPVATWTAGQTVTVSFQTGGAAHSGGHCQFSISYDGGETFAVIENIFSYCFFNGPASGNNNAAVLSYDIDLPKQLPSGPAIFSWSWVNASGNREFYMNCADIEINGGGSSFTGQQMLIANYGSQYPVIPEFGSDYSTGLDLYNAQPQVTVSGNGSTTTSNSTLAAAANNSTSQNISQSAPPVYSVQGVQSDSSDNTSQSAPPVYPVQGVQSDSSDNTSQSVSPAAPDVSNNGSSSNNSSTSDSCLPAAMRCSTSANGFDVCNQGTWLFEPCSQGTVCAMTSNGFPQCTW